MQKLLKMKGRETMKGTSCEECAYFEYDEDEEELKAIFERTFGPVSFSLTRMILQKQVSMEIVISALIFNIEMNTEL